MKEDYVSYDLALKLKRVGFCEPCYYGYSVKTRLEPKPSFGVPKIVHSNISKNFNDNRKGIDKGLSYCSAPTLWQAQKWLQEKHKLYILVDSDLYGKWYYKVFPIGECCINEGNSNYVTYEQALSAGIESALQLIGKGE